MNNYEIHELAQSLADTETPYTLARSAVESRADCIRILLALKIANEALGEVCEDSSRSSVIASAALIRMSEVLK